MPGVRLLILPVIGQVAHRHGGGLPVDRHHLAANAHVHIELRPHRLGSRHDQTIALRDRALATSGDYRNYREVEGVRVAHTIDPRTGRPLTHRLASVTVVERTCARADALATALLVLGPGAALELAEERDIAALLVVADGQGGFEERITRGFEALAARAP